MIEINDSLALEGFTEKRKYVFKSRVDIVSKSPRRMFKFMFGSSASAFKFESMSSDVIVGESCAAEFVGGEEVSKKHDFIVTTGGSRQYEDTDCQCLLALTTRL